MPVPALARLSGGLKGYAWGCPDSIPDLLGLPPTGDPVAELWLGAHPSAPSVLETSDGPVSLLDLVREDPEGTVGKGVVSRLGPRFPFLLKVLAAREPLSIQVHPTREQARTGYARETLDGPGLYADDDHKPELLCPLTGFEALCGFRDPGETLVLLESLAAPRFLELSRPFLGAGNPAGLLGHLLALPDVEASSLVEEVVTAAGRLGPLPTTVRLRSLVDAVTRSHPGDVGLLAALLLNHLVLEPGQAVFLPAGVLHAYVRGTGVEVMASSDDVLRCGLTSKRVDVPEVLSVLDPSCGPVPVLRGDRVGSERRYAPPVEEFVLAVAEVSSPFEVVSAGPTVVLVTGGEVTLEADGTSLSLSRGAAAYVAPGRTLTLRGAGTVFRVTTNLSLSSTAT